MPCIRSLRIPVATVVGMLADGMSNEEILSALSRSRSGRYQGSTAASPQRPFSERELPLIEISVNFPHRQFFVSACRRGKLRQRRCTTRFKCGRYGIHKADDEVVFARAAEE